MTVNTTVDNLQTTVNTTMDNFQATVNTTMDNLQKLGSTTVSQVESLVTGNPNLLKSASLVTAAVLVGGVGGYLLAKGAFVAHGVANGVVAAKGGATAAPVFMTQGATAGTATLQNTATLLNSSLAGGTALVDKIAALFQTISTNATPLTVGVVGGGAAGVGATRYQVRQAQDALAAQSAQTAAVEAERSQLADALSAAKANLSELQTKLAAQPAVQTVQDQLEAIKGIGRVFAQKLNAAGIYTFADLAAQTPDRLRAIIGTARAGSMVQPADWIQQARQRIQPDAPATTAVATPVPSAIQLDRLEAISGITPAIAARLNQTGILTYADLAGQSATRIQEALGADNQQPESVIAAWLVAARALATQ
jgi:predicted flap endonuclease-1-like 5' DNA nuclease